MIHSGRQTHTLASRTCFVNDRAASLDHLASFLSVRTFKFARIFSIKNIIKAEYISQLRGTYGGDTFNVGREFRLRYIPVMREPFATISTKGNPLFWLRG